MRIQGIAGTFRRIGRVIQSRGSRLVFRIVTALASVQPSPVVVTGDVATLRKKLEERFTEHAEELWSRGTPTGV
ncbi:hypothetical protein ACIRQQ_43130 [Streptomyces fuscichromogenes]|uniref:hypothetical protein n=1 Tax=Streptomyces fuscichromogenes TaxID=1324013 RepID=UPI0037F50347